MLVVVRTIAIAVCALLLAVAGADRAAAQAITVDPGTAVEASAASISMNHTVGTGTDRYLIVSVAIERRDATVSAVTYAGQALTFIGRITDANTSATVDVWGRTAPATGTNQVVVTLSASAAVVVGAVSFANVSQSSPVAASNFVSGTTGLTASGSVASATDQMVVALIAANDSVTAVTAGAGQTSRFNLANAADVIGAASTRTGSASSTMMSYSFNAQGGWGMGLVALRPSNPLQVINTNDSGAGSLRNAIQFANSQAGASTVTFAIPGAGPHTIILSSALPDLTANGLTIDGSTQSGTQCRDLWAGNGHDLRINLRGAPSYDGFRLSGANQTVRGISVTNVSTAVNVLGGSSNAVIQCNYLGLLPNGTGNNNAWGVMVAGSGARIGGLATGEGNVISSSSTAGVVTLSGSTDTAIRGNFIGTDPTGMVSRPNATAINNFNGNATWRDITRNLISGNNGNAAIVLETDDRISPSNGLVRIQANVIGTNRPINALMRNTGDAILFDANSITGVLIGGTASTEGNIMTGNDDGIDLRSITNATIRGNTIGISGARGISLNNVNTVEIGGTVAGQGNTIGGNNTDGIYATNSSTNLTILGNVIQPIATIGGTFANGGHGIWLDRTSNVVIGNGTAAGRNVIGGNRRRNIQGTDTNSTVSINGNYIGTDATGNTAVASGQNEGTTTRDGISFDQGGTFSNLSILNNVIGGHESAQIELFSSTGTGITIQGNSIGVGANGTSRITTGTTQQHIRIGGGGVYSNVAIGGSAAGQGNVLAFSDQSAIMLDTSGSNIQVIGNTIRDNSRNGIDVLGSTRVTIVANRIYANGLIGIDLADNGVTANDAGDGDSGPNNLLNYPVFTALNAGSGGNLLYTFTLDAPAEGNGYRIDFYRNSSADPSGFGEGEIWLGSLDTGAHAGGAVVFSGSFTPLVATGVGAIVSATATRKTGASTFGETSEFNQNRTVVSPLVVTSTSDTGTGSLREAVVFANAQATASTISFAIPGAGPHTITLASALPDITANGLTIDGTTQSGTQCRDLWLGNGHDLRINLRGGSGFTGLRLGGSNQLVRGLSITGFNDGVEMLPSSNTVTLHCNYIGLLANGTSSANGGRGVHVFGAGARIGGLDAGQGNIISSNTAYGVQTRGGSADTAIRGNFIGTDAAGMSARANGTAINNQDGSATWRDITRNLIAGNNGAAGIALESDDRITASDGQVRIQRNTIGFTRTLSALLPNGGDGIFFESSSITGALIGGTATSDGNTITGSQDAIDLRAVNAITIRGNTLARSSARGIWLAGSSNITIGGTAAGEGNNIGGNGADGIFIGGDAANVTILGNLIQPVTIAGATAAANASNGIWIERAATVNIGDGTAAGRNVIGGNRGNAIRGTTTNANVTINGNYIGTDASGNVAVANAQGMDTFTQDAIAFGQGNFTGVNILNNVVGGHRGALIEIWDSTASNVTIQGNRMGVGVSGNSIMPADGIEPVIYLDGPTRSYSNVLIGGSAPGQGNVIANAASSGLRLGSTGSGIVIAGNTVRNNAGFGVSLLNSTRAALVSNTIFANGLIGIDLNEDWITANDTGDGDSGANDLLNFPATIRAIVNGPNALGYNFTLDAPAAANGYRVEFFGNSAADASGFGEGERYLGHVDIAHAGGAQTYTGTLTTLQPVAIGDIIAATTTRRTAGGSWDITSEFSAVVTADGIAQLAVQITSQVFDPPATNPFATPGNDIILTANVTNTGTGSTDANSIFLVLTLSPDTAFFNDVTPEFGGVVGFSTSAPSLTFTPGTDLRFSNAATPPASFAQCTYTPAAGYDPQVRYVCLNQKGSLPPAGPQAQFTVQLRSRIR